MPVSASSSPLHTPFLGCGTWLSQLKAGSAEEQRPEQDPLTKGNSLVGDSSHAAGAPGLLHGPQEEKTLLSLTHRPEIRQEHPLNLSISISGGKETNQDSPSSGERTGTSPTWKSPRSARRIVV